jgi:hypothetical protein
MNNKEKKRIEMSEGARKAAESALHRIAEESNDHNKMSEQVTMTALIASAEAMFGAMLQSGHMSDNDIIATCEKIKHLALKIKEGRLDKVGDNIDRLVQELKKRQQLE